MVDKRTWIWSSNITSRVCPSWIDKWFSQVLLQKKTSSCTCANPTSQEYRFKISWHEIWLFSVPKTLLTRYVHISSAIVSGESPSWTMADYRALSVAQIFWGIVVQYLSDNLAVDRPAVKASSLQHPYISRWSRRLCKNSPGKQGKSPTEHILDAM